MKPIRNICCIGGGYVGGPSGAIIANKVPDIYVTVVDIDRSRIAAWNSSELPVYEPYLYDVVVTARDGIPGTRQPNLFFTTDFDCAVRAADLIFLNVATPTKQSGLGAGRGSDLNWLEHATRSIAKVADKDTIIVEKSTVPAGTADALLEILTANAKENVNFEVLSNPEFLAEGTAVKNLLFPDRVLIGRRNTATGQEAARRLGDVYERWIPSERIVTMDLKSCELSKVAANALLAQRISSINALSAMCERLGASVEEVSFACGLDKRIGPKMLNASVGFGGSCFEKDVMNLSYVAETLNLPEVSKYWESIVSINDWQKERFTRRIIQKMHNNLARKKIAVLGFAYKKHTGDTRESPAINVVKRLLDENAHVSVYDPKVLAAQIYKDVGINAGDTGRLSVCSSPYDACDEAHAALILTDWDIFGNKGDVSQQFTKPDLRRQSSSSTDISAYQSNSSYDSHGISVKDEDNPIAATDLVSGEMEVTPRLDWSHIATIMQRPKYVFDGRRVTDKDALAKHGFNVEVVGSPSSY